MKDQAQQILDDLDPILSKNPNVRSAKVVETPDGMEVRIPITAAGSTAAPSKGIRIDTAVSAAQEILSSGETGQVLGGFIASMLRDLRTTGSFISETTNVADDDIDFSLSSKNDMGYDDITAHVDAVVSFAVTNKGIVIRFESVTATLDSGMFRTFNNATMGLTKKVTLTADNTRDNIVALHGLLVWANTIGVSVGEHMIHKLVAETYKDSISQMIGKGTKVQIVFGHQ